METLKILLTIIFVLVCIALSVVILMQEGKNNGLGALTGGAASETYLDKNKGRTKSGKLLKITKILAVLFLLLSAVLNLNFDRSTATDNTDETSVETTEAVEATEEAATTAEATEEAAE